MFPGYPSVSGSGKIVGKLRTDTPAVQMLAEGWPSLLEAMAGAEINTPRRVAAFLTTLVFESWCLYGVLQGGSLGAANLQQAGYTGRGLIQLTGIGNYRAAGDYLRIDLVNHPELAQSMYLSARIAIWYWTVARPKSNRAADGGYMGLINRYVGYPLAGSNDADRCMVYRQAVRYLTGELPEVNCSREAVLP